MIWSLIFVAILVGGLMPFQGAINARLADNLPHPLYSALISFIVGGIFLFLLCLCISAPFPSLKKLSNIPPYLFIGGLLGPAFVFSSIILMPKLGTTVVLSSFVAGQLLFSLILDHYGLLSLPVNPLNIYRVLGVAFLGLGVYLVTQH